jgi:twitching motility protein PilT
MAAIDQLLQVLREKGNDEGSLLLEPGREARLESTTGTRRLTRGPLDGATIHRLLQEVAPAPLPASSCPSPLEFAYTTGAIEFQIRAAGGTSGWRASVRRTAARGVPPLSTAALAPPPAAAPTLPSSPAASPPAAVSGPRLHAVEPVARPLPPVAQLLVELVAARGSDLHLSAQQPPRWRIDGDLQAIPGFAAPSADRLQELLWEIAPLRNREEFGERSDTDFAYELPGTGRFRVNLFRDRLGPGAVMRQIPEKIPTAEDLGLSEAVRNLAYLSKGLVLVTGPTGSGKSTTLAAIIDLINRQRHDHIITIEDPVEFVHPSRRCLVNQREVHVHTQSFKQALRAALREDPDVVLVGELRDLETISIAIETAETGHLVFGTLHTTTAISTVERLVDQFPGDRQEQVRMMLADSLKAVIAQTLLKKVGGGRVAAQEILLANPAVSNLIREGKTFQLASAMQTGRAKGMILLNDALLDLVKRGVVAPAEAYLKAVDKETIAKAFAAANIELDLAAA